MLVNQKLKNMTTHISVSVEMVIMLCSISCVYEHPTTGKNIAFGFLENKPQRNFSLHRLMFEADSSF